MNADHDGKANAIIKRGMQAYDRIQHAIKVITLALRVIETPEDGDSYQIEMIRAAKEQIGDAILALYDDSETFRRALLDMNDVGRSVGAAYRTVYQALPNAYHEGEQAAKTQLQDKLRGSFLDTLRQGSPTLAALSDDEYANLCDWLRDTFAAS
jgi:hypothetical protein